MRDWIENTGTVPDEVGPETVIEVQYRDGGYQKWFGPVGVPNNDPDLWSIEDGNSDIIRWRMVN